MKNKERFMSDENFALLLEAFKEAAEFERGERNDLRTTVRAKPAPPKPRSKRQIAAIRQKLNYSQTGFARLLNVSPKTIQAWEQGTRRPDSTALKLLAVVEAHPEALLDVR